MLRLRSGQPSLWWLSVFAFVGASSALPLQRFPLRRPPLLGHTSPISTEKSALRQTATSFNQRRTPTWIERLRQIFGENEQAFEIWFNEYAKQKALWLCGILLTLVGQTIMVPGLLMQKMTHRQIAEVDSASSEAESSEAGLPYFLHRFWLMGTALYGLGHFCCWIGLGMAPQSILACLQCWNMVIVMLISPYFLDEEVPKNAFVYCAFLICGCVCVVAFGPPPGADQILTLSELSLDVMQPILLVPVSLVLCFFLFLQLAGEKFAVCVSTSMMYAFSSAVFAWYAATLSKSTSALVDTTLLNHQNQIHWGFALVVAVFIILAVMQIHLLNMALKHGEAITVIPFYEGVSMVGQIAFGGLVFHEFAHMNDFRFTGFVFGVIIVVACLSVLTSATMAKKAEVEWSKAATRSGENPQTSY